MKAVGGFEDQVRCAGGEPVALVAGKCEQILGRVRQAFDLRKGQESGESLDGMKAAKQGPQGGLVGRIGLQCEQMPFGLAQVFIGLYDELGQYFRVPQLVFFRLLLSERQVRRRHRGVHQWNRCRPLRFGSIGLDRSRDLGNSLQRWVRVV